MLVYQRVDETIFFNHQMVLMLAHVDLYNFGAFPHVSNMF